MMVFSLAAGCSDGFVRTSGVPAASKLKSLFSAGWSANPLSGVTVDSVTCFTQNSYDSHQHWFIVDCRNPSPETLEASIYDAVQSMSDKDLVDIKVVRGRDPALYKFTDTPSPSQWEPVSLKGNLVQIQIRPRREPGKWGFLNSTVFVFSDDDKRVFVRRVQP
jgi:hypothetical protein